MEDKEKIENKVDLKRGDKKNLKRKVIIRLIQLIIILFFLFFIVALVVMIVNSYNESKANHGGLIGHDERTEEINWFNSQWEAYVGTNKTAAEVKTMCSAIIASNASEQNNGSKRYVGVYFDPSLGIEIEEDTEINVEYGVAPASSRIETIDTKQIYTITAIYGENDLIIGMKVKQTGGNE